MRLCASFWPSNGHEYMCSKVLNTISCLFVWIRWMLTIRRDARQSWSWTFRLRLKCRWFIRCILYSIILSANESRISIHTIYDYIQSLTFIFDYSMQIMPELFINGKWSVTYIRQQGCERWISMTKTTKRSLAIEIQLIGRGIASQHRAHFKFYFIHRCDHINKFQFVLWYILADVFHVRLTFEYITSLRYVWWCITLCYFPMPPSRHQTIYSYRMHI